MSEPRGSVVKASGCKGGHGARRLDLEAQLNLNLQQLEVAASVCPRAAVHTGSSPKQTQFPYWFLFRVARPSGGGGRGGVS